jgi:hypothetical protein
MRDLIGGTADAFDDLPLTHSVEAPRTADLPATGADEPRLPASPSRRSPQMLLVGAAALLVIVIAIPIAIWRSRSPEPPPAAGAQPPAASQPAVVAPSVTAPPPPPPSAAPQTSGVPAVSEPAVSGPAVSGPAGEDGTRAAAKTAAVTPAVSPGVRPARPGASDRSGRPPQEAPDPVPVPPSRPSEPPASQAAAAPPPESAAPAANETQWIVRIDPDCADATTTVELFIDKKPAGTAAPGRGLVKNVTVGEHTVSGLAPDGHSWGPETVNVAKGVHTTVFHCR